MHRSRFTCAIVLILVLGTATTMTSCGGGSGGGNPDLVLLGFNVPNLSGIPLNQPLIFTFSANINPATITPDSLRVVGTAGPFFEKTVVDGNLIALLPTVPNFANYSDAGLQPNIEYTVSLTEFPAVTTIESVTGKPLLAAESFTFRTTPTKSSDIVSNIRCNGPDGVLGTADDDTPGSPSFFIEPRRSIRHGIPWTQGGRADDAGCLQNSSSGNSLWESPGTDPSAIQGGSGPGARLLCLQNEGSPRVIETLSIPRHGQLAVGTPSAVQPGLIDLPAIRVKINEPLDPLTVEPFFAGIPVNIQLWRVALKNGDFSGPLQIRTNKPIIVQDLDDVEIILVAEGPVPQGVYLVNITPAIKDLPGCPLRTNDRPDPAPGGFDAYEAQAAFSAAISPGYRIYFTTLEVPDTPLSIIEDFNNNLAEWGDNDSGTLGAMVESGVFSRSVADTNNGTFDGKPIEDFGGVTPTTKLTFGGLGALGGDPDGSLGGQSTTAEWNGSGTAVAGAAISTVNGYRFLNLPTLFPNGNVNNPNPGTLQAVHQPWAGNGLDGGFDSNGSNFGFDTDTGSVDSDGIWQFQSFHLRAGDTLAITGSKPWLVLCQGDFIVDGTIELKGLDGSPGFDTDGTALYTNTGAEATGGVGGVGGPGGGAGGVGADPVAASPSSSGTDGVAAATLFETVSTAGGGGAPGTAEASAGANDGSAGGGGGGFSSTGGSGISNAGGALAAGGGGFGDAVFLRAIALFNPDRGYHNNSNISGGTGGGGGSSDDDTNGGGSENGDGGTVGNGDDGGGGGGGGGGGMWVLARGVITVSGTGVINADGGAGGNTYGPGDQSQSAGDDGDPQTAADNVFTGLAGTPANASGDGGPGGGGSGGAIFLVSRGALTVASGASLSALGGAGGTSGDAQRVGGAGSAGHITLVTMTATPASVAAATTTPAAFSAANFPTPVENASVGQSDWVDLFTTNTDFAPFAAGQFQFPSFHANFTLNLGNPGFLELPLGSGGAAQTAGVDFDAKLEFQGADFINDGDGNTADALTSTPTEADGLTLWVDASLIDQIDTKRFVRWRWRFFAKDGWGAGFPNPPLPLPTVFDVTIPFVKN